MRLRLLLDTHILIRWLSDPKKLSHAQVCALEDLVRNGDRAGLSDMSLVEIAVLSIGGKRPPTDLQRLLDRVDSDPLFQILPVTSEIAREIAAMGGGLRDPADQTIVATARVHRLKLLTADQRIIDSGLASVID